MIEVNTKNIDNSFLDVFSSLNVNEFNKLGLGELRALTTEIIAINILDNNLGYSLLFLSSEEMKIFGYDSNGVIPDTCIDQKRKLFIVAIDFLKTNMSVLRKLLIILKEFYRIIQIENSNDENDFIRALELFLSEYDSHFNKADSFIEKESLYYSYALLEEFLLKYNEQIHSAYYSDFRDNKKYLSSEMKESSRDYNYDYKINRIKELFDLYGLNIEEFNHLRNFISVNRSSA